LQHTAPAASRRMVTHPHSEAMSFFRKELGRQADAIAERAEMLRSANAVEYSLLAIAAAWEAVVTERTDYPSTRATWLAECRKAHPRRLRRRLADVAREGTLRSRAQCVSAQERKVGFRQVQKGMRVVWEEVRRGPCDPVRRDWVQRVDALIGLSVDRPVDFPDAERWEAFLLTAVALRERIASGNNSCETTHDLHRRAVAAIRRWGPPAARTLADAAPVETRCSRPQADIGEHREAIGKIVRGFRRISIALHKKFHRQASRGVGR
jgi:hypothetical protein